VLKEVIGILIEAMLDHEVLEVKELSHITFNQDTGRYENGQLHVTLMNSGKGR